MDFQKTFKSLDLQRLKKGEAISKFAARILADSLQSIGIGVQASEDIGGGYATGISPIFEHTECWNTATQACNRLNKDTFSQPLTLTSLSELEPISMARSASARRVAQANGLSTTETM